MSLNEREKQHQLELLEIEELEKTIPIQKYYGVAINSQNIEALPRKRGQSIFLSYSIKAGYRIGFTEPVIIFRMEDGYLLFNQSKKRVPVEEINWRRVIAIIKYYKKNKNRKLTLQEFAKESLNGRPSIFDLTSPGDDCKSTTTFSIELFDASYSYKSKENDHPKIVRALIDFFMGYFN